MKTNSCSVHLDIFVHKFLLYRPSFKQDKVVIEELVFPTNQTKESLDLGRILKL